MASFNHSGRLTVSVNGVDISEHVMDIRLDPPEDRQGFPVTSLPDPLPPQEFTPGPLAPRVIEKREQDPCEYGHFYEDYRCIYCDVQFCATEYGGHSFETSHSDYGAGKSPADCWHCHKKIVNLRKGSRR